MSHANDHSGPNWYATGYGNFKTKLPEIKSEDKKGNKVIVAFRRKISINQGR